MLIFCLLGVCFFGKVGFFFNKYWSLVFVLLRVGVVKFRVFWFVVILLVCLVWLKDCSNIVEVSNIIVNIIIVVVGSINFVLKRLLLICLFGVIVLINFLVSSFSCFFIFVSLLLIFFKIWW